SAAARASSSRCGRTAGALSCSTWMCPTNAVACQLQTIVSWIGSRGCMMLGMHPWIELSDDVRLGVLTEWMTADLVDEVLAECGKRDKKPGALPARFMVYYVLALALFQQDSYDDVAENLGGALEGMDEAVPDKPRSPGPGSGW